MKLHPIGIIETPFTEKFGIPRQGSLAKGIAGKVNFEPQYCNPDYLRGLEQFTHLWLTFGFHQHFDKKNHPLVRPPRLGGNEKIGVFASRSSFRPNPIGLSLVKYEAIEYANQHLSLRVRDVDLLNGTPIYDIKPYIPYSDIANEPSAGYASQAPSEMLDVTYTTEAYQQAETLSKRYPDLCHLLDTMLASDPRPAYKSVVNDTKRYGFKVYDLDVSWRVKNNQILITQIIQL